jgi:protein-S-isoprenylcysteine O-methyltransferase Ste14
MPTRGAPLFAWAGAALFAASMLYFLYTYIVTFAETANAEAPVGRAVLVDTLLFSAFALHHSVFARLGVRAHVARFVREDLERSVYVWIASLLLIVVCVAWLPVAGAAWRASGLAAWALRMAQVIGIWLTIRSASMIDVFELSGVRQAEHRMIDPDFTTVGPYGWVRHPIYAGWFIVMFAQPTMTMTKLVFAVTSCIYLLIAMPFEERSLLAATGDAYRRYTEAVRWKLIPGVY